MISPGSLGSGWASSPGRSRCWPPCPGGRAPHDQQRPETRKGSRPSGRNPLQPVTPQGARALFLQADRLPPALAVAHIERDLLALLHIGLAGALQHGGVQEDILPAIIRGDEAEAAHLVEPLDGAVHRIGRPTRIAVAEIAPRRTVAET